MSKNRFDFEQEIMHCWHVTDDIKVFAEREDITVEQWKALAEVYSIKFDILFNTFEAMVRDGKIN